MKYCLCLLELTFEHVKTNFFEKLTLFINERTKGDKKWAVLLILVALNKNPISHSSTEINCNDVLLKREEKKRFPTDNDNILTRHLFVHKSKQEPPLLSTRVNIGKVLIEILCRMSQLFFCKKLIVVISHYYCE